MAMVCTVSGTHFDSIANVVHTNKGQNNKKLQISVHLTQNDNKLVDTKGANAMPSGQEGTCERCLVTHKSERCYFKCNTLTFYLIEEKLKGKIIKTRSGPTVFLRNDN